MIFPSSHSLAEPEKKRVKYFIMNLNIDSDTLCNSLCFSSIQSHFIALAFSISQPNVLLIKIHELCTTFNVSFLRHLKKERLQLIINLKRALRVEYSKLELILGCALFRNYVRLPIFVSYRRKRGLIAGHNNGHEAHKYSEISFPRPDRNEQPSKWASVSGRQILDFFPTFFSS